MFFPIWPDVVVMREDQGKAGDLMPVVLAAVHLLIRG